MAFVKTKIEATSVIKRDHTNSTDFIISESLQDQIWGFFSEDAAQKIQVSSLLSDNVAFIL